MLTSEEISKLLKEKNDHDILIIYSAIELRQMVITLAGFNPIKNISKQRLIDIMRESERALERSKTIRRIKT